MVGPARRVATLCERIDPLITIRLSRKLFFVLAAIAALAVTGIIVAA
jgi:hypothetical protein